MLADIVEARFPAIVTAEIEPLEARIADRKIVQAHRLSVKLAEILLQQGEIVGERLVAMDVGPWPAIERPGRETPDIGADVQNNGPRRPAQEPSGRGDAWLLDTRYSSRPCSLTYGGR